MVVHKVDPFKLKLCFQYFTLRFTTLQYFTMILQRIRITVGDAGFEPGTSALEVFCFQYYKLYSMFKSLKYGYVKFLRFN